MATSIQSATRRNLTGVEDRPNVAEIIAPQAHVAESGLVHLGRCGGLGPIMRFLIWGMRHSAR